MIGFARKSVEIKDYRFSLYNHIQEIQGDWDSLLPENHHLKSGQITIFENTISAKNKYVIVKKGGKQIGVLYLQIVQFTEKDLNANLMKYSTWECLLKSFFSLSCETNIMVCGNLFRTAQQGYYFNEKIEPEFIFDLLHEFIETTGKNLNITGIFIKENEQSLKIEKARKFTEMPDDLTMQIEINPAWNTMEQYVNDLSKKYKKRYQKIKESGKELVRKDLNLAEITLQNKAIFDLYLQIANNQPVKIGELLPNYFIEMKRKLGDNFKLIGIFLEGKLVAFSSHIYSPNRQKDIHYIGLDYALNTKYNLYFNILFWGLEMAIDAKQTTLELGRTANLAKASLGATPVQRHNYIFLKRGIIKLSWWIYTKSLINEIDNEWKKRSPFLNAKLENVAVSS